MITASMVVATIPVTDLERSKQFYGEIVGLTFLWENTVRRPLPMRRRQRALDLQAATGHDRAHPRPLRGRRHRGRGQEPVSKGVEFLDYTEGPLTTTDHIAQLGPARGAWFHDPDGNTLGIRQG